MQMEKLKVKITLQEDMLATKAANKDLFTDFIASKCADDDKRKQEIETAEHCEEAGTTVFHRHPESGELMIWDYQVKGFLKEAGDVLRASKHGDELKPWRAMKKKVDNNVFIFPRMITLGKTEPDSVCERPLRAQTMKGERVSLTRSESIAAGTSFEIEIQVIEGGPVKMDMVKQMLDYGALKGLGQWRNAGWGRISWEVIPF